MGKFSSWLGSPPYFSSRVATWALGCGPVHLLEHTGHGGGVRTAAALSQEERPQLCPYLEIMTFCYEGSTLRCGSGVGRPFLHGCHGAQAAPCQRVCPSRGEVV